MKVITVCGSLKFIDELKEQAERLTLAGYCVLTIVYPTRALSTYSSSELALLRKAHFKKIEISEAIFVVNKAGYIGKAVAEEITYAKAQGKNVLYLENDVL
ncbi:hypothetical protein JW886_06965 [Lactococcus taiwanensis]|uniref:Uncharacterized protein n=2 Tax=Lactococcus taiwanensis TaxID=1151742 RepID=A0AA45KF44_9LACT|nr:hypothetical protein [Lactococcus taiwanensis]QSE76205.1 hypothetical protein JW886_06965 [Lactococcus taiwanensis]